MLSMTLGGSLLLISVAMGSITVAFSGFCCCLASVGIATTNVFCKFNSTVKKVVEKIKLEQEQKFENHLDELDEKLLKDKDPRDQTALRNLRALYDSFIEDFENGKISPSVPSSMVQQIDRIYHNCVHQLEHQYEIWETSKKVSGDIKISLIQQKSKIVDDVVKGVDSLSSVINEVRSLGLKAKQSELTKLQNRLDIQLTAAKAVDEFTSDIENDSVYEN